MNVGDRVVHVDYPNIKGTITYKMSRYGGGTQQFSVLWDNPRPSLFGGQVRTSRHIWSALKLVSK